MKLSYWSENSCIGGAMANFTSLKDHFLIATLGLEDPFFSNSLVYLCEHTPEGAMGLIINHPSNLSFDEIFNNCGIELSDSLPMQTPVYEGGPVQKQRGFVLHNSTSKRWQASATLNGNLQITVSKDILVAIANNKGPSSVLMALGYAAWEPGQLEKELQENIWLCAPANPEILFDTPPEHRLEMAAKLIGVNFAHYSLESGHA
jgi:putative transcriptional regulator